VLGEIFQKDMVIRGPEFKLIAEGKAACIQSYVGFASAAKVISFATSEPVIDIFDDMATAKYSWNISYAMDDSEYDREGDEVLMFVREDGRWFTAWRAQGTAT